MKSVHPVEDFRSQIEIMQCRIAMFLLFGKYGSKKLAAITNKYPFESVE